jgi:hypothetical protein
VWPEPQLLDGPLDPPGGLGGREIERIPLSTYETVLRDTPAWRATSAIVTAVPQGPYAVELIRLRVVYLEDVAPDGSVTIMTDGVQRLSLRGSLRDDARQLGPVPTFAAASYRPMRDGEPNTVTLTLNPLSVLVLAGHRLRLSIAGGDEGTFADPDPAPERETTFTIECNARRASVLRLPVAGGDGGPLFGGPDND